MPPDSDLENSPEEIYKPGKPVGIERSQKSPDGTPVVQLAYVVGHRHFVDPESNKTVHGIVVAFLDKEETPPPIGIKFAPCDEIKVPPLSQVGNLLSLPETTLPFQGNDTPAQRLIGPNNPDNLIFYLEDRDGDPFPHLNQAQLVQVSAFNSITGEPYKSPSPSQRALLQMGGKIISVNYQECLVLQALRGLALQDSSDSTSTVSSETNDQTIQPDKIIEDKSRLKKNKTEVVIGGRSWVGSYRSVDEDCIIVSNRITNGQGFVDIAVFDGVGGPGNGDKASNTAMLAYKSAVDQGLSVSDAIQAANKAVFDFNKTMQLDSGSTAVAIRIHPDGQIEVGHVGDSRAYLVNQNGTVTRLTTDHSYVQRLVDTHQITPEEAKTHPLRNVIYRSLGDKKEVKIDTTQIQLEPNQAVMVACDGLEEMLNSPPQGVGALSLEAFIGQVAADNNVRIHQVTSQMIWNGLVVLHNQGWDSPDNVSFVWAVRTT